MHDLDDSTVCIKVYCFLMERPSKKRKMEPLKPSKVSMRTKNPIRNIVDKLNVKPNPEKEFISLALGDPTIFGNLRIDSHCVDSVQRHLNSYKANGYPPSIGTLDARASIAKEYSRPNSVVTASDVIIASGLYFMTQVFRCSKSFHWCFM
jgi:tyrosine aminotransferase